MQHLSLIWDAGPKDGKKSLLKQEVTEAECRLRGAEDEDFVFCMSRHPFLI